MPDVSDTRPDPLTDDVGALLRKLNARAGWTQEAVDLLDELLALLKRKKYYRFDGHPSRYHLQGIGESYVYDVPMTQRGHLERFRGKTVRVVCVSSGRFDRSLMAGKVG
jgi:hypothetical protein